MKAPLEFLCIEREIEARPDADLEHPTLRGGDQAPPVRRARVLPHRGPVRREPRWRRDAEAFKARSPLLVADPTALVKTPFG